MRRFLLWFSAVGYRTLRPFVFLFDCETMHELALQCGVFVGRYRFLRAPLQKLCTVREASLETHAGGISLSVPVGLSAGYDYEGRGARIMQVLGFGFTTVGTTTSGAYEGNPKPRLARLVQSQSLVVNKGFKNPGIEAVLHTLGKEPFAIPVGISVGQTNKQYSTQEEQIDDVVKGVRTLLASEVPFSYLELNISCPNLAPSFDFYSPDRFAKLLSRVQAELTPSLLGGEGRGACPIPYGIGEVVSTRGFIREANPIRIHSPHTPFPLWIKMPISRTDEETRALLDVCKAYHVSAVVLGNLQTSRAVAGVLPKESARYPKGNLSGVPTRARSNELIARAYRQVGKDISIVGCGGIFSADDAYTKIRLGASLVELITGLIWQGPQLPAQIALGLADRLKRDGFSSVRDAVGIDA